MESRDGGATLDDVFEVLKAEPRRDLLLSLLDKPLPEDHSRPVLDGGDDPVLYHEHLPKLDAHDFIEWDRTTQSVTAGPNFDRARPFLELIEGPAEERSPT